jgi:S-DNA-T family DNA segregation ATPase FtsK/SpoIIIE
MQEAAALLLVLAGLTLGVALASYDPADPSWSTATAGATSNLAGPAGAHLADVLLQGFGWAGALPVLALLAWAWRLGTHRGLKPVALRLAGLLAALPLLAATLTVPPLPAGLPAMAGAGGAAGTVVAEAVIGTATELLGPLGMVLGQTLLVLLSMLGIFLAFGLSSGEWRRAGRGAGVVAGAAALGAARLTARGARHSLPVMGRIGRGIGRLVSRQPQVPLADMLRRADAAVSEGSGIGGSTRVEPRAFIPGWDGGEETTAIPPRPLRNALARVAPAREEEDADEEAAAPLPAAARPPRVAERATTRPSAAARQGALDLPQEGQWRRPPLSLLQAAPAQRAGRPAEDALQANARLLESVLEDYGVRGRIVEIRPGPVVTLYELEPAPGTKSARVIGLADDIARSMSVMAVRIATVPGRNVIGIELPNARREMVYFSEMMAAEDWARNGGRLALALGKDIGGAPVIADLARMPHLLIAGTTGSGKSVGINTMILSLLYRLSPDECRFIMIDPKMLELSVYDRIPHLLAPVVTEPPKAIGALKWTVREMERRYRAMSQLGVRNIAGYNEKVSAARAKGEVLTRRVQVGFDPDTGKPVFEDQPLALEHLPMIVVIIDEVADLMMVAGKEIEAAVQRLAQMARAAGIHVIMATQRPSVDVITGTIKANFPTRISFQVTSKIDSRTILGEQGAEQLLGQGDMLHMAGGGRVSRVHGPFVSDEEVERVVEFLREQGEPHYVEEVTETEEDDGSNPLLSGIAGASDGEKGLFDQAVALVTREGKASTSFIQRHLNIGYNRAAKLIEQMEKEGVVGPANHVGKREVLARRSSDD